MRSKQDRRQWQQPRRRGFDDDNLYGNTPSPAPFPSFAPSSSAPEVQATAVKWFNAEKGYGFAALANGSGDVFLHVNALQTAGCQTVNPGATLKVRVGSGQKGRQIDQVLSVDESTAEAAAPRRPQSSPGASRRQADTGSVVKMVGIVKWYNPDKGFGFITPESGGKDVFIHATVLERAGLAPLRDGQSVRVTIATGAKDPEVDTISLD